MNNSSFQGAGVGLPKQKQLKGQYMRKINSIFPNNFTVCLLHLVVYFSLQIPFYTYLQK